MFKSYLTLALRNLTRKKGYSFINIGGLATGMTVALLIGVWIYDELTFNHNHGNHQRIGRVMRNGTLNGETFTTTFLPYALGDELKTKYGSNFKKIVMAWPVNDHILSFQNNKFSKRGEFIEAGAPEMFSFSMLSGSHDALKNLNSVILSESSARTLFGDGDPINQIVTIDNTMEVKVTGVYKDFPHNSHFYDVHFFAPWDLFVTYNNWMTTQGFSNNFLDIYVELSPATDFQKASENVKNAIVNNVKHLKDFAAVNPEIFLHPMDQWHLYSEWKNGENRGGGIQLVWLFGITGIFVVLLACINFMNLSTARSEKRAKEVGIRKTIGSVRSQLVRQFLSESFLVVIVSFLGAIILASALLPWFNDLAGKQMSIPFANLNFWLISSCFIILTGLVAGSYPAFYLSSFLPVKVLKGTFRVGRAASIPRKVLVVAQFTVSVTLVIGTIIVYQQIEFAKARPVGYKGQGLIMIQMTSPDFYNKLEVLETSLKNTGVVSHMAESTGPVTAIWSSNGGFEWKGKDPDLQAEFATLTVSPEYGSTVGWEFVKGRDFSASRGDSSALVITESVAKLLGFEDPVGEVIRWRPVWRNAPIDFTIVGVIRDMVMESPYAPPQPSVFFLAGNFNWINIRIAPSVSAIEALPKIEEVFKELIPAVPFAYRFADQEYARKFTSEERVGKLALVFSGLAILISCLGLFGLASFVAEQRTKEIGIRKILGASVVNLCNMLSKDFVVLVLISCVFAVPTAYFFMVNWLQKYQYHTDISWWIPSAAVIGATVLTLITVSYQGLKTASRNPVKSLRSE
jgi:putative ABC transport system permease protein